ncbi:MAG TPA: right-handed parallel beta-helix repeat-containing protein, partial [Rhodanobacteraceae bacterium]|nr:right-handed parallel beta-helix repeat-containing protein [Rhodanobacteraceae bacterium]
MQNCDDDGGPDTLRSQIAAAGSGDTIDLSQLACSKITLTQHHALEIHQDDLSLKGPASGASGLTISAAFYSGVVYHTGAGTLSITDLTLSNGIFVGSNNPRGGCIYSAANVYLSRSVVSHCRLQSTQASSPAVGGGIFTQGDLTLASSTITDSAITDAGSGAVARGGGAFVRSNFSSNTSTISDNFSFGQAGGVFAASDVTIRNSTFSGNVASAVGALEIYNHGYTVVISNSTISDNHARNNYGARYGGIWSYSSMTITSSTIAFNSAQNPIPGEGEGVYLLGASASIQSSIIAGNFNESGPADLGGHGGTLAQDSANNLITSSTLPVPFDTIKDCPKLDVLADTGGNVKTHGLL